MLQSKAQVTLPSLATAPATCCVTSKCHPVLMAFGSYTKWRICGTMLRPSSIAEPVYGMQSCGLPKSLRSFSLLTWRSSMPGSSSPALLCSGYGEQSAAHSHSSTGRRFISIGFRRSVLPSPCSLPTSFYVHPPEPNFYRVTVFVEITRRLTHHCFHPSGTVSNNQ